jgi:hypothetical protein
MVPILGRKAPESSARKTGRGSAKHGGQSTIRASAKIVKKFLILAGNFAQARNNAPANP